MICIVVKVILNSDNIYVIKTDQTTVTTFNMSILQVLGENIDNCQTFRCKLESRVEKTTAISYTS